MRMDKTFLHSMIAHHAKRHNARSRFIREAINGVEIIGEVQGSTIKFHVTIGAQAEDITVDVWTTPGAAESMNVRTFSVVRSTRIYP